MDLYSLWVELVECSVNPHCDVHGGQPAVLSDLVDDGGHSGSADLSCAVRHGATHLLDYDTVITRAVQPQVLQDGPDLQERQAVTRGRQIADVKLKPMCILMHNYEKIDKSKSSLIQSMYIYV